MNIQANTYVAIDYTLRLDNGEIVDQSRPGEPLGFVYGFGRIIPGLERQLEGLALGASAKITVEAEDAYGVTDDELLRDIPRDSFPNDVEIKPGMSFQAHGPHGPLTLRVTEVRDDVVQVDLNHPLAGERLHFEVKVTEVREPTPEELEELESSCNSGSCGGCGGGCH